MGSVRLQDNKDNVINTNYQAPLTPLASQNPAAQTTDPTAPAGVGTIQPKVNLFTNSTYQTTPQTITLQDGRTITLPSMSEEAAAQMRSLFASVPQEKQQSINNASSQLATAILQHVALQKKTIGSHNVSKVAATTTPSVGSGASIVASGSSPTVSSGSSTPGSGSSTAGSGTSSAGSGSSTPVSSATTPLASDAGGVNTEVGTTSTAINGPSTQASAPVTTAGSAGYTVSQASPDVANAVGNAVTAYAGATGKTNFDTTVQAVTYMGVQGIQQELGQYATQMQGTINQQNTIRTDQSELTQAVADWPPGTQTQTFTFHNVDSNGNMQTYTQSLTESQAKAMSDTLTNTLSTLSASTEMQNQHLQNMEQNYQQAVTEISNIMNEQYQMVKNTLSNIHY